MARNIAAVVLVDVRPSSPTYGRWVATELSAHNGAMLYVPRGFAHARFEKHLGHLQMMHGFVGMQRDRGHQGVVGGRRLDGPPGTGQVAADLHDPGDSHGRGQGEGLHDRGRALVTPAQVHVAVVVHHRVRQRLGDLRAFGELFRAHGRCTAS